MLITQKRIGFNPGNNVYLWIIKYFLLRINVNYSLLSVINLLNTGITGLTVNTHEDVELIIKSICYKQGFKPYDLSKKNDHNLQTLLPSIFEKEGNKVVWYCVICY